MLPLYGYGQVQERCQKYVSLIKNSKTLEQNLKQATTVIIISHSQGCIVSSMLLYKLIQHQIFNPQVQQISMIQMAGIHLGPYPDIEKTIDFYKATNELFQFSSIDSLISKQYLQILTDLIHVKHIHYIVLASFYDEVVPFYSATLHHVNLVHNNVYKGFYMKDGLQMNAFLAYLFIIILNKQQEEMYLATLNSTQLESSPQKYHDLLIHISGLFRKSIWRNKLHHSEIHHDINVYNHVLHHIDQYYLDLKNFKNFKNLKKKKKFKKLFKNIIIYYVFKFIY